MGMFSPHAFAIAIWPAATILPFPFHCEAGRVLDLHRRRSRISALLGMCSSECIAAIRRRTQKLSSVPCARLYSPVTATGPVCVMNPRGLVKSGAVGWLAHDSDQASLRDDPVRIPP